MSRVRNQRRDRRAPASHADDWLMTYADTITLLLCLFMVLLSLSAAKKDHGAREGAQQTATPSKPFDPFGGRLPFPTGQDANAAAQDDADEVAGDAQDAGVPVRAVGGRAASPPSFEAKGSAGSVAARAVLATAKSPSVVLPATLAGLTAQGASVEQHGSRLTTVQMSSAAFFGSGSAVISPSGRAILRDVTASLTSPQFEHYRITVEGHTDDTPISSAQFPSNWELSTARASAVVHFFLDQGIAPERLRAAGYADTFPLAPNRDADGYAIPENQAKNRRVVIKLERLEDPG